MPPLPLIDANTREQQNRRFFGQWKVKYTASCVTAANDIISRKPVNILGNNDEEERKKKERGKSNEDEEERGRIFYPANLITRSP